MIGPKLNEEHPRNMIGREARGGAGTVPLPGPGFDPVLDGLRSAVRYDKTYFDKIVASLLPPAGEAHQPGKISIRWMQVIPGGRTVIRKRAVVYVGLDALSDAGCHWRSAIRCSAISCRSPGTSTSTGSTMASRRNGQCARAINVHADEFNELMGDEFIPLINKGGGAGLQVTACVHADALRTSRPVGNRAKAGQVIGNFNNLFMLGVRETATAELLTEAVAEGRGSIPPPSSPARPIARTSVGRRISSATHRDRISMSSVPMIEPSRRWTAQRPMLRAAGAASFGRYACRCRRRDRISDASGPAATGRVHAPGYSGPNQWWEFTSSPALQDAAFARRPAGRDAAAPTLLRWPPAPTMAQATRPCHEGCRLDRAALKFSPRRSSAPSLTVPVTRGADRLAAVLDRGGVRQHAPVLERTRLAPLPAMLQYELRHLSSHFTRSVVVQDGTRRHWLGTEIRNGVRALGAAGST